MPDGPQYGQEYKEGSSGNVSPAKERVLSTNPGNRRNNNRLRTLVRFDGEVYIVCERNGSGKLVSRDALMLTTIWYLPFNNLSESFLEYNLVNVGRPAVLIQFWKCSSSWRFGGGFDSV